MVGLPTLHGPAVATLLVLSSMGALSSVSAGPTAVSHASATAWKITAGRAWSANGYPACASSGVPVLPHYLSRTMTARSGVWADLNESSGCQWKWSWSNSTAFVELSTPIRLSGLTHNVTVNWSLDYSASEAVHTRSSCPLNRSGGTGCEAWAEFLIYESSYVWDVSTSTAYCEGAVGGGPSPPFPYFGTICGPTVSNYTVRCPSKSSPGSGCVPGGGNMQVKGTLTSSSVITDSESCGLGSYPGALWWCIPSAVPFNSSHQYTLDMTVGAFAAVASVGWVANASAAIDLSRPFGSTITGIAVR